ncbi:MAG TPA: NAD-dependent epimerase/dehydratase family protein [Polyangiaceae bacterium]|nr:NAD-dependent epimerase/dehydratase family protein [Polyangiaceae bacterium]
MTRRILISGASGFVGSALLRRLAPEPLRLRCLMHTAPLEDPSSLGNIEVVQADLTRPESLQGLCSGVDALVHLASAIEADEETCRVVNEQGTRALVQEAERAGVSRMLYLSTAAVYGDGIHRGIKVDEIAPRPASATSASRLAAESIVLRAGGAVLRPMFIYGTGDKWFIPAFARLLLGLPFWINGGHARLSVIAVDELARLIAAWCRSSGAARVGVYHANFPEPVSVREIGATLASSLGLPLPSEEVDFDELMTRLNAPPELRRKLALVSFDRFYASSAVWQHLGLTPDAPFQQSFLEYASYYRAHLGLQHE